MFLLSDAAVSVNTFVSLSVDIDFSPANIAANAGISSFLTFGSSAFAGFSEFTTVDENGVPTQNAPGTIDTFPIPALFANNVDTVTFVFGVADFSNSEAHVVATCQIYFFDQNGNLF